MHLFQKHLYIIFFFFIYRYLKLSNCKCSTLGIFMQVFVLIEKENSELLSKHLRQVIAVYS
jgi:hypothetical protein